MLIYSLIVSVNAYLTAGVFYSGFLAHTGMDASQVGLVAAIPFLANLFCIFSADLLGRFRKRKVLLICARFLYHTLNILTVTVLPYVVKDVNARTVSFCAIVFVAGIINALSQPGITELHLSNIPGEIRSDYFAYVQTLGAGVAGAAILLLAFLQDRLAEANPEIFTWIRIIAYVLALLDVVFMALPSEPEYKRTEKVKLSNAFRLPLKNRKYMWSILFVSLWTFTRSFAVANIIDNYLTVTSRVPYIFICAINASYTLFLIFFQRPWKKLIRRTSWFKTFAIAAILHSPTTILYAFTNSVNFIPVMLIVRLTQHVIGVGANVAFANLPYVNMPEENRTDYMSFNYIAQNLSSFIGMSLGTLWIRLIGVNYFTFFGVNITGPQQLLLFQGVLQFLVPLFILLSIKKLE
ncbi:MAG: MFS transporter [Clostridia bacterium]|nr:MFS transporter [Clostridia bacterium]